MSKCECGPAGRFDPAVPPWCIAPTAISITGSKQRRLKIRTDTRTINPSREWLSPADRPVRRHVYFECYRRLAGRAAAICLALRPFARSGSCRVPALCRRHPS